MTDASTPAQPVLSLRELGKSYAAPVLEQVNLHFFPGEVHALLGANGAGKSTLARIVSGLVSADTGVMTLAGALFRPAKKSDAEARGVQIVQQELTLIPTLSIAENLFLHRLPALGHGPVRLAAKPGQAGVCRGRPGPSRTRRAGRGAWRRRATTGRDRPGVARSCQVLILDEPTAALSDHQVELLFRHVARLRAGGVAILYISHRLDEVRRIADRISVLRDGRVVASEPAHQLDMARAVRLMVGTGSGEDLAGTGGKSVRWRFEWRGCAEATGYWVRASSCGAARCWEFTAWWVRAVPNCSARFLARIVPTRVRFFLADRIGRAPVQEPPPGGRRGDRHGSRGSQDAGAYALAAGSNEPDPGQPFSVPRAPRMDRCKERVRRGHRCRQAS